MAASRDFVQTSPAGGSLREAFWSWSGVYPAGSNGEAGFVNGGTYDGRQRSGGDTRQQRLLGRNVCSPFAESGER